LNAGKLAAELFLRRGQELFDTPGVEHVFEARLGAIGAVAVIDEDANHRVGNRRCVRGLDDDSGLAREILVSGDAAEQEPKPYARLNAEAVFDLDGLKADVVGIFEHGNDAGAVEADIELARDAVKGTVVENVKVPFARAGARVDQLLRVDAGGGRAGDVADIVRAGPA